MRQLAIAALLCVGCAAQDGREESLFPEQVPTSATQTSSDSETRSAALGAPPGSAAVAGAADDDGMDHATTLAPGVPIEVRGEKGWFRLETGGKRSMHLSFANGPGRALYCVDLFAEISGDGTRRVGGSCFKGDLDGAFLLPEWSTTAFVEISARKTSAPGVLTADVDW